MAFFTVTRDGDVSNSLRTGVMYLEDTIEQVSRQLLLISNIYTALYTRGSNSYTLHNLEYKDVVFCLFKHELFKKVCIKIYMYIDNVF